MGRGVGIVMTVLSDLFHAVAIILMVVCLAVGNAKPTNSFSWLAALHPHTLWSLHRCTLAQSCC